MTVLCKAAGLVGLGAILAAVSGTSGAAATETFDNPMSGGVPCMTLISHSVDPDSGGFKARAVLENVCGRTMDVSVCFNHVGADGASESCYGGIVRPTDTTVVVDRNAGGRIIGPTYEWRYASGM